MDLKDKKSGKGNTDTAPQGEADAMAGTPTAVTGELVKKDDKTSLQAQQDAAKFMASLGLKPDDLTGFEQTASGEITRWFDIRPMMEDPNIADKLPAKAKPNVGFAGVLLGMSEMKVDAEEAGAEEVEDEDTGEVRTVRYFYFVRLTTPCPVTWKDDNNQDQAAIAKPGEIIAVGERFAFKKWRAMATDGGSYYVVVQPVERRRLRRNPKRLMWHFNVWEKTLRVAPKVRVETVAAPAALAR